MITSNRKLDHSNEICEDIQINHQFNLENDVSEEDEYKEELMLPNSSNSCLIEESRSCAGLLSSNTDLGLLEASCDSMGTLTALKNVNFESIFSHDLILKKEIMFTSDLLSSASRNLPINEAIDFNIYLLAGTPRENDNHNLKVDSRSTVGELLCDLLQRVFEIPSQRIQYTNVMMENCHELGTPQFYLSLEIMNSGFVPLAKLQTEGVPERSLVYHNIQKNIVEFLLKKYPTILSEKEFTQLWKDFSDSEELSQYLLSHFFNSKFIKISSEKISKFAKFVLEEDNRKFLSNSLLQKKYFDKVIEVALKEAKIRIPITFGKQVETSLIKKLYQERESLFHSNINVRFEVLLKKSILEVHLPKVLWTLIRKDELNSLVGTLFSKRFKALKKKKKSEGSSQILFKKVVHESDFKDLLVKKVKK